MYGQLTSVSSFLKDLFDLHDNFSGKRSLLQGDSGHKRFFSKKDETDVSSPYILCKFI